MERPSVCQGRTVRVLLTKSVILALEAGTPSRGALMTWSRKMAGRGVLLYIKSFELSSIIIALFGVEAIGGLRVLVLLYRRA